MNKNNVQLAIVLYLIFIGALIYLKPAFLYDETGNLKQFGTGSKKTIFPLWLLILLGSFFSFFIAQIIIYKLNL